MQAFRTDRRISWEAIVAAAIAAAGWAYTAGELQSQVRLQREDEQQIVQRLQTLERKLEEHELADVNRHKEHEEGSEDHAAAH